MKITLPKGDKHPYIPYHFAWCKYWIAVGDGKTYCDWFYIQREKLLSKKIEEVERA